MDEHKRPKRPTRIWQPGALQPQGTHKALFNAKTQVLRNRISDMQEDIDIQTALLEQIINRLGVRPTKGAILKRITELEIAADTALDNEQKYQAALKRCDELNQDVHRLEAERSEHADTEMHVRWTNRLLMLLTAVGVMGLYKLWRFI